jgi:hypothetical protein
MIEQRLNPDLTVTYTVTDHLGRKIGSTEDRTRAELWEHQQQWQFRRVSGLAAAGRLKQNEASHLVCRNSRN